MLKMSCDTRRVISALIWAPTTLSLLSHFTGLNWFGKYERYVIPVSLFLLVVAVLYIGPSLSEMRQRGEESRRGDKDPG